MPAEPEKSLANGQHDDPIVVRLLSEIAASRQEAHATFIKAFDKLDRRIDKLDDTFTKRIDKLDSDLSKRIDGLEVVARTANEAANVAHAVAESAHENAEAAVEEATGQHDLPKPETRADAATKIMGTANQLSVKTWLFLVLLVAVSGGTAIVVLSALKYLGLMGK